MTVRSAGLLLGLGMLALLVIGIWFQQRNPRRIVGSSTVTVVSARKPGPPITLDTRRVAIGLREIEEVRLPNGTWIDCAGDCRKAALAAGGVLGDDRARAGAECCPRSYLE